jgi:tyrosine-protein phosphatase YwqE
MDATAYRKWKQRGVLLQLNLPSLVGAYGPEALHKAEWLLNQGLYDFCGSDTHSINHTRYFLNSMIKKKTVKKVRKLIANTFIIE